MDFRHELIISQIDALWRVSATDNGRRNPTVCRNCPTQESAVEFARLSALQMAADGGEARVVLKLRDDCRVVWSSVG